jgi:hypothetical protein
MLTDSLPTNATLSFGKGIDTARDQWRRKPFKITSSRMTRADTSQPVFARQTHDKLQLVRKPSDWTASCRASIVQHGPTKMVFEISARPGLRPDDTLTLEDFRARLVHEGESVAPATAADLDVLRGEAVLMALFLLGLAWPATVNADR